MRFELIASKPRKRFTTHPHNHTPYHDEDSSSTVNTGSNDRIHGESHACFPASVTVRLEQG